MAFKSFTCITASVSNPIPPEGWSASGDAILIANNTDLEPIFYMPCDSNLSHFVGAAPIQHGMTYEEFSELWPMVLLIMFAGYGVRKVISIFAPH